MNADIAGMWMIADIV